MHGSNEAVLKQTPGVLHLSYKVLKARNALRQADVGVLVSSLHHGMN